MYLYHKRIDYGNLYAIFLQKACVYCEDVLHFGQKEIMMNIKSKPERFKWEGEHLQNLLLRTLDELAELYPEQTRKNLERRKQEAVKMAKDTGKEVEDAAKEVVDQDHRKYLHTLLDTTIDELNIDPASISKLKFSSGSHEGYIKNSEGEIEYTKKLRRGGLHLTVEPKDFKPKWTPVHTPMADIVSFKTETKINRPRDLKVCVVLPDPQIGFRRFRDGTIDPFHDDNAISIALQIIADLRPDKVVCLGDFIDAPMFGRFEQSEDYAHTAQLAINYGYRFLGMIRALVPNAEIVVIEGNHDRRIEKNITSNSLFAFGLSRADDIQDLPVMSIPNLLAFDKLNIKYVEGYPAGKYWINENLQAIHGHIVRQAGATAAAVVKSETVSTIFGHVHRIETAYDTQNTYQGARANLAHTPGCLCRIDGGVPSAKGSTQLDGRPVISYENWQNGLAVVDYKDTGTFNLHPIYINTFMGYETSFNNKLYVPRKDIIKQLNSAGN